MSFWKSAPSILRELLLVANLVTMYFEGGVHYPTFSTYSSLLFCKYLCYFQCSKIINIAVINNFVHMYFHVGGLSSRVDWQILDQNVF